ncbi:MAG: maleylpyruvate isomerase N-terminal domain-containing protein [Chloroflexi bacterium]|nr:maleylpyruvate isomerase N-terminal domain-containing protein [Chloroflexota bacterium]
MALAVVTAAIRETKAAHRDLLRLVDSLSDADWSRPVPYGEWTVKDMVAHLVGDLSPGGAGLILAGILTPEFIAGTARTFDRRPLNASQVEERARLSPADLRQMLFVSHDAMFETMRRLTRKHLATLALPVPMGPEYELTVEDWLWSGYHDRSHGDDIRRALEAGWRPEPLAFLPEIEATFRAMWRCREGFLRAVYSVAEDAWDEPSPCRGWSYRDLLAHVVSNELRPHARLRYLLGEGDPAELKAIVDVDRWNQQQVEARRGRSLRELADEMAVNRYQTLRMLSRLRPEHLDVPLQMSDGSTLPIVPYIEMFTSHESRHAGQLVPASRARRWKQRR